MARVVDFSWRMITLLEVAQGCKWGELFCALTSRHLRMIRSWAREINNVGIIVRHGGLLFGDCAVSLWRLLRNSWLSELNFFHIVFGYSEWPRKVVLAFARIHSLQVMLVLDKEDLVVGEILEVLYDFGLE